MDQNYVTGMARECLHFADASLQSLKQYIGGAQYALEQSAINEAILEAEAILRNLHMAKAYAHISRDWTVR